jgi:predicted protein tyrosine phosphatase
MRKVLFLCSQNMLRSPTAEAVFSGRPGLEVSSAGTEADAECPVSADLVEWADDIFVMETYHLKRLRERFSDLLDQRRVVVLGIRDNYEYMDPELVEILKVKVTPHLERYMQPAAE